jgi:eukaryotic-like serine/threonine-protein kinase
MPPRGDAEPTGVADMHSENNSSKLLSDRVAAGDPTAADEVFHRYLRRLTALARARLAPSVGRRVDPEDAVQSAFRSFFLGARTGRFRFEHGGDLWRLLATITGRKAARLAEHHRAGKRSVGRERPLGSSETWSQVMPVDGSQRPRPEDAVVLADELLAVMRELSPDGRRILELRLQGHDVAEIAGKLGRTERTIRRRFEQLHELLAKRLDVGPQREKPVVADHEAAPADAAPALSASPALPPSVTAGDALPRCDYRDFVLQLHLGSGGMGRVYRAWQRSEAREVAVKVLRKNRQTDRAAVERFEAEARTIAGLDHPHVTKLYGIGRMPAGGYFFAMQLVEGGDLETHVGPARASHAEIAKWLRQAAAAITAAHERGVVHCDLKPANLLLDRDDNVVVSDFGFAQVLAAAPQTIGGTLAYAAPELIDPRFGPISPATDVWGLGAVLFALLTGRPPWPETDIRRLHTRLERRESPALNVLDDSPLAAVCRRCLAIDPADRYADAKALATALP